MNPHMSAGQGPPHFPPNALPAYQHPPQSRRNQDYHTFNGPPPQSPMHMPHYYQQQPFYPPPHMQQPYHQNPRWQGYSAHPPYPMPAPPQPRPYPSDRPMVVNGSVNNFTPQQMPPSTRPPMFTPTGSYTNYTPHPQSPSPLPPRLPQQPPMPQAQPSPAPPVKQEPAPPPAPIAPEALVNESAVEEADVTRTPQQSAQTPAPPSRRQSQAQSPLSLAPEHRIPYYPKLPWYSVPGGEFPQRDMARRRKRQNLRKPTDTVTLPAGPGTTDAALEQSAQAEEAPSEASTVAAPSEAETPATSQAPSESDFTHVSTPATPAQAAAPSPKATPTQAHARRDTRTAIAVPNIPGLPKHRSSPSTAQQQQAPPPPANTETPAAPTQADAHAHAESTLVEEPASPKTPPPKAAPKSWADLVRTKNAGKAAGQANGAAPTNSIQLPKTASLPEALRQYSVQSGVTLSFLEPRGLVNTGNMCYMNSVRLPNIANQEKQS